MKYKFRISHQQLNGQVQICDLKLYLNAELEICWKYGLNVMSVSLQNIFYTCMYALDRLPRKHKHQKQCTHITKPVVIIHKRDGCHKKLQLCSGMHMALNPPTPKMPCLFPDLQIIWRWSVPGYITLNSRLINPSETSGYYLYHKVEHSEILHLAQTVYLCVLYDSHNKQHSG